MQSNRKERAESSETKQDTKMKTYPLVFFKVKLKLFFKPQFLFLIK